MAVGVGVGLGTGVAVGVEVGLDEAVALAVTLGDGDDVAATGVVGFGPDATAASTPTPTPVTAMIPSAMTRTDLPREDGRVATCPLEHPTSASRNARSSDRGQDRPSTQISGQHYARRMDDRNVTGDPSDAPTGTRAERVDITQGGLHDVHAGSITLSEGGITTATADAIDIQQGGIVHATATDIAVMNGGIVLAQAETVSLDRGFAVGMIGDDARVVQSAANFVGGRDTTIDQSLVVSAVAEKVTMRQPSLVGVLIANRVEGTVRPILDWRGALVLGVAFALVARLIRRR